MSNITTFLTLLAKANAVTVDGGPELASWETSASTGEPENEVVAFSWQDDDFEYWAKLSENAIAKGVFQDDGTFVTEDHEGEETTVQFFFLDQITPTGTKTQRALTATQTALSDAMQYAESLSRLLERLTEKVERANTLQHSGSQIAPEDWSELYILANESRAILKGNSGDRSQALAA